MTRCAGGAEPDEPPALEEPGTPLLAPTDEDATTPDVPAEEPPPLEIADEDPGAAELPVDAPLLA